MTNPLIVYEFSRKVLAPQKLQDKWVSSGFDKEIGCRIKEVPPSIENAVHSHWFRINDNYPPAGGEIALIAREIGQYAVLAVATRLADEAGRPLIGCRYFWLEKPPETEIDGVGTLLKWWLAHKQPRFELKPHQEIRQTQEKNRTNGYYNNVHPEQPESFGEYRQQVEDIIPQIKYTPHIFTLKEKSENSGIPDYLGLHSLALYLKKEHSKPIAWAWNVSVLENPNQFTLICCANEEYIQASLKLNTITSSLEEVYTPQVLSPPTSVKSTTTGSQSLKKALTQIAENKQFDSNFTILTNELAKSNSTEWDWGQIIDGTWLDLLDNLDNLDDLDRESKKEVKARYKGLILLLNPNLHHNKLSITPSDWINSIKASQEDQPTQRRFPLPFSQPQQPSQISPVNQYAKSAVALQSELIQCCYANLAIADQLQPRIYEIISQLLLLLRNKSSIPKEDYKVIEWLFCDSVHFWRNFLVKYAKNLFNEIKRYYDYKEELTQPERDVFIDKILEDLKIWEKNQENQKQQKASPQITDSVFSGEYGESTLYSKYHSKPLNLPQNNLDSYQQIAQIFEKVRAYNTAAFFYQISTRQVPESVEKNCKDLVEIIPLNLKKKEAEELDSNSSLTQRKINFKVIGWILLGAIIGTGLGIGLEAWQKWGNKFFYPSISENKSEIIPSNPVLELYLYLNLLETGDVRKELQAKNIKNLDELIKQIPQANDEKLKKPETRKELPKERAKFINSPLYNFVKQLTPPVKERLDKTYKADQVNANPHLKSPEIQLAKAILQEPLAIYQGKIKPIWDQDTSDAIINFQTQYKIQPAEGTLDQGTWSVLFIMIQDRQVKQAAEKFKTIIEESKNYQDFKTKYDKLKQCKTPQNKTYSTCLDEIFKK